VALAVAQAVLAVVLVVAPRTTGVVACVAVAAPAADSDKISPDNINLQWP